MADKDHFELSEDLDRLLQQELSIEPSPAFAAGIRRRVAEQHRTPWWRARWIPAIGSAATLASLAFAVGVPAFSRWTSIPVAPAPPAVRLAVLEQPRVESLGLMDARMPAQATARTPGVETARRAASLVEASDLPVVIVDGRQRDALTTLFRMMNQGRVSGDSFATTTPVSMDPIVDHVAAIAVAPVVVSAIPPGGVLPNESER